MIISFGTCTRNQTFELKWTIIFLKIIIECSRNVKRTSLRKLSRQGLFFPLFQTCKDLKSQYILLEKLFGLALSNPSVLDWLQGESFGEKLMSQSRTVCDRDIDELWREETTSLLNILSLVLATRAANTSKLYTQAKHAKNMLE